MLPRDLQTIPKGADEILRLLIAKPDLSETLEGFARWRLMQECVRRHADEVASTLEWLVNRGLVVRKTRATGDATFSLNPKRSAEAQRLLTLGRRTAEPDSSSA